MTFELMMEMLKELEAAGDVSITHWNCETHVTFNDFDGFTEDWLEEVRLYNLPNLVELVEDIVEELGEGDTVVLDGVPFVFDYSSDQI